MKFVTTTIATVCTSILFSAVALAAAPAMLKMSGTVTMNKSSYDIDVRASLKKETNSKAKYVANVILKNNQGTVSYTKVPMTLKKRNGADVLDMTVTTKSSMDFYQQLHLDGKIPSLEDIQGAAFDLKAELTESNYINIPGSNWEHNHTWITVTKDRGSAQLIVIE